MNRTLTFIFIFSLSLCAGAQQFTWSLKECIDYALENNIQIKKNIESEHEGKVSLEQAKGALRPSLSFTSNQTMGYRPFTEVMSVVQGDLVTSTRSNVTYQGMYGLNANMTLWNGGINQKNVEAQRLQNQILALNTEQSECSIQEQIAQLYVQILYSIESKKVSEQLCTTTKKQYDRGVTMYENGLISKADLSQLEAQYRVSQYDVVNAETQILNFKRQLKKLLELNIDTEFDVVGEVPDEARVLAPIPAKEDVYIKALDNRPEIKSAILAIKAADINLDIAKRGYLPTFGMSASAGSTHTSGNKNNYGEQLKTNFNLSAGVNVSVPIFDNRRNRSAVKKAKIQQSSRALDLEDQKMALASTIEQYWLNARSNQERYISAREKVKSQDASYELLNEQFQNGLKNIVELLQGHDALINAKQDELQSKYTTILNLQLLNFYAGGDINI